MRLPAVFPLVLVPIGGVEQDQVLRQSSVAQTGPPAQLTPQLVRLAQVHPPHVVLLPGLETPLCAVGVREPGPSSAAPQASSVSVPGRVGVQRNVQLRQAERHLHSWDL